MFCVAQRAIKCTKQSATRLFRNQQQILLALFLGFSSSSGLLPFGPVHVLKHVLSCVLRGTHQKYWSFCLLFKTHKNSWKSNGVEKSLCHVAMVAKFLDDNKPKISLKKWIRTVSNFDDLIQFHLICQMMAKFSGVESERTVSKFRKRKRKFLRCARLLRKAGAWNLEVSRRSRATTAKKRTKKRDARTQLLLCWYKTIAFFQFSLPSLAS